MWGTEFNHVIPTQKLPILTALAQAFVFDAMHKQVVGWFTNPKLDPRVRHAVATVHKAVVVQAAQAANLALGDRCGAQGLFEANQFSAIHVRDGTLTLSLSLPSDTGSTFSLTYAESRSPKVTCWEYPSVRTTYTLSLHISAIVLRSPGVPSRSHIGAPSRTLHPRATARPGLPPRAARKRDLLRTPRRTCCGTRPPQRRI